MGIGKLSQELRTALAQRTVAPGDEDDDLWRVTDGW